MKNASRSKFLLCFRPVIDMEMAVESESVVVVGRPRRRSRTKPLIEDTKVVEVKEEEEMGVNAPLTKTMSLVRECNMVSHQTFKESRSRYNRTFSRARKVRDSRALRQDSFGSERRYSTSRGNSLSLGTDELMTIPSETSNSHQLKVISSSNPDSPKQSPKNQEDSVTKPKKNEKGSCELNSGMYLLLISLGITVFWGRVFAILFTSLWLYSFTWSYPTRYRRRQENVRKWSEAEVRDQKRRVIIDTGAVEIADTAAAPAAAEAIMEADATANTVGQQLGRPPGAVKRKSKMPSQGLLPRMTAAVVKELVSYCG